MYNSSRTEDFHVKNISSNIILQLCEKESNCQPKLEYQKYSCKLIFREFKSIVWNSLGVEINFEPSWKFLLCDILKYNFIFSPKNYNKIIIIIINS